MIRKCSYKLHLDKGLNDIEGGTSGGLGGFLPTGLSANGINTPYGPDNNGTNTAWQTVVHNSTDKDYQKWNNAYRLGYTSLSFSKWKAIYRSAINNNPKYRYTTLGCTAITEYHFAMVYGLYATFDDLSIVTSWEPGAEGAVSFYTAYGSWIHIDDLSDIPDSNFSEGDLADGGELANNEITLNETATGVSAIGFSNSVKGYILDWGMQGANWGKTGTKYIKAARGTGIAGSVFGMGVSGYNMYTDYSQGGINAVNGWDIADFGVGATGLGATIFLSSNPVGWAIAGGATIYFGARFIHDISTKP